MTTDDSIPATAEILEGVYREEWGGLLATLIRLVRDIDLAEEFAHEAILRAMETWPASGVPDNPAAWLVTTARNRARDHFRRRQRRLEKEPLLQAEAEAERPPDLDLPDEETAIMDDRLRLIFTCCHPLLGREARAALTLRLMGGLSTGEIARAFLVSESTIAQRIVRAKKTIRDRGIPYRVPDRSELPRRTSSVLEVLYLIFNEGYSAGEGTALVRSGLCREAMRLASLLAELLPDEAEVLGLLALLEFQSSRHETRTDARGRLVLLEDQDRSRWDRLTIERGRRHLEAALATAPPGVYTLQAAIAERHAVAPGFDATDWSRIASLYEALSELTPTPVVALNRAVAVGMLEGPEAALGLLEDLEAEPKLREYHLLPATRADFLRRAGRKREAADQYRRALDLVSNETERDFLEQRLSECERDAT